MYNLHFESCHAWGREAALATSPSLNQGKFHHNNICNGFNRHTLNCICLDCTISSILTYGCPCETTTTVKVVNRSFTPKSFPKPFCNPSLTPPLPGSHCSAITVNQFAFETIVYKYTRLHVNRLVQYVLLFCLGFLNSVSLF